jgi:hypothetical protein
MKRKNMLMSHKQNAGQNHNIKMANRHFENVAGFKYLRATVTNDNLMRKGGKSRLYLANAYCHSKLNPLHPKASRLKYTVL